MTNPPIDPFREAFVTSTRIMIGPEHDITTTPYTARHARRLELRHPLLMPAQLQAFRHMGYLVRALMPPQNPLGRFYGFMASGLNPIP